EHLSQLKQALRRINGHPPGRHIDFNTDCVGEGYQELSAATTVYNQDIGSAGPEQADHDTERVTVQVDDLRSDHLVLIEFVAFQRRHLGFRDNEQAAGQGLCGRHRIVSPEFHNNAPLKKPETLDRQPESSAGWQYSGHFLKLFKPPGYIGFDGASDLSP